MTSSNYGVEEEEGYLVPNKMNNNSQKELSVQNGYLVPNSPGFQVRKFVFLAALPSLSALQTIFDLCIPKKT
jgi:hypothetical protein